MAIAEDKARIAITLGKGVLERLDAYCKRSGMSRSQYISYAVAHQLDTETQVVDYVNGAIGQMFQQLAQQEGYTLSDFIKQDK
jgi:metal-responsive CopG/Arc/MetJ family transcriptional regulator